MIPLGVIVAAVIECVATFSNVKLFDNLYVGLIVHGLEGCWVVQLLLLMISKTHRLLHAERDIKESDELEQCKQKEDTGDSKELDQVFSDEGEDDAVYIKTRGAKSELVVVEDFWHVDPEHRRQKDEIELQYNKRESPDAIPQHGRRPSPNEKECHSHLLYYHEVLSLESTDGVQACHRDEDSGHSMDLGAEITVYLVLGEHVLIKDRDHSIRKHKYDIHT